MAAVKVIPREYPNIFCGSIDISPPPAESRQEARLIELLSTGLRQDISSPAVAYRGLESLEQYFAPVQLADTGKVPSRLKEKGVYMISGGLTGSGFEIAQYLAATLKPKLAIIENPGAPGSSSPDEGERPALTGEWLTESRIALDMNEEVDFITQIEERIEKERDLKGAEDFQGLEEKLNDLCSACILDYFKQNGVAADTGSFRTLGDLKKKLRLQEKFNKFLGFFLSILAEDQLITFQNEEITFLKRAAELKDAVALKEEIEAGYPEFKGSLKLLDYCRQNYTRALSGEVEAISILYPGGRSVEVMEEYQDEVETSRERLYIHLFKEFIAKLLEKKSKDKKLRVLEIGAGKGLLTYVITPGLNAQDVEYHFTDIGNFFVVNAKKETEERGFDFMKFGVLDITKDPGEQGYENHSFDLIVGLNVVNAARSVEEALGNVKPLLAPGGLMCLIEGTNAKRWLSMVVGLAEGWWYFEDSHLRPDCALLNLDTWQEVFEKQGFQDVFTYPMDKHKRAVTNCGIIFGRQESEIYVESREVKERKRNLKQLEKTRAEIRVIEADVTDPEQMQQAVALVQEKWGQVDGLVHCIEPGENGNKSLEETLSPTIKDILTLDEVFKNTPLDFFVICSSLHSLTAPVTANGTMGNSAVDIFVNSFSQYKLSREGGCTVTINWDANAGINIGDVFKAVLDPSFAFSQLVVSADAPVCWLTGPPAGETGDILGTGRRGESAGAKHQRPELSSRYAPPRDETEQAIAGIWQEFFGIDQVGIYDDFLELGADSLVFVTIAARIHKALDVNIPIPVFFEKLNVSGVAQYIKEAKKEVYAPIEPLEKREYYVASSVQRRLYFLQQMDKQSLGYNIPRAQILEGTLDKERIEIAFRRLIERHESLRTSFTIVGELPVQLVHETFDFAVEHYDLPGNDGNIDTIISQFVRPFDLSRAPLFRVGLIKESEERHIFMVDIHHVIADGISVGFLLVRDFMYFYSKQTLPGLTVHYKDYDRWLGREEMQETIKGQKTFWMKEFEGEVPVLELPTDFIRPEMHSFDGKSHMFEMGKEEADALKNFALKEGTSFFFLLLSTYYVILSKLSSQEDIVIGTPVSGRRHTDMENVVGMFINTVALRNFPKAGKTFIEFLREVKERSLTAFSNQDFQYEDLVQEVDVDRDTSRNPLFDVMFILENFEFADLEIEGLDLKPYWYDPGTSIFDQLLVIIEWGDILMCRVEYSTKL
ncbi:MAG: SDR family oxidoreductase, partial [bacterium]|nr:SDR family oxidoreductase [bacterium]